MFMNEKLAAVYLSLGSNIEPADNLKKAIQLLQDRSDVRRISSIWESAAIGSTGPNFLNAIVLIHTALSASDLKSELIKPLESELERVRTADKFAPRTIDIDILVHNDVLLDEDLFIQAHLAVPFAELYPEFRHAVNGIRIGDAAEALSAKTALSERVDLRID